MPTPTVFVDIDVINQALTGFLGENEITNLATDQSVAAIVMRHNYEAVSEAAQTKSAWRFNTTKAALSKLTAEPQNRWSAGWQLPNDHLKTLTTWPISNYEIQGNKLYTNNTDAVEIDYQRKLEEAFWPSWFLRYVVARLVIRTSRGITGEKPTPEMKDELKDALDDALFQDAQQQPNQTMMANAFIDVRH